MTEQELYINEDNLIRWDQVKRVAAGTFVTSGTFTWQLRDDPSPTGGTLIASGSLAYVGGSGRWEGTIDKTDVDDLTEGATYYAHVTGSDGAGADGFRRLEMVAQYHGSTP